MNRQRFLPPVVLMLLVVGAGPRTGPGLEAPATRLRVPQHSRGLDRAGRPRLCRRLRSREHALALGEPGAALPRPRALVQHPESEEGVQQPPTTYSKYVTWSFDPDSGRWDVIAPAPVGLDTLVTTKHGVLGVNVDWPTRLNDAGYLLPWSPDQPEKDNAVYLFEAGKRSWKRLGAPQTSPQNLYEMTSLAHDSKRDRLLLHGGGKDRDELWAFDLKTHRWQNLRPKVSAPAGAVPPVCNREAVYLPEQDVLLTYGPAPGKERQPALWAYRGEENAWYRIALDPPAGIEPRNVAGQNRALAYDPVRDLVLLVVAANDRAEARVCALCYRHDQAKRVEAKER